MRITRAEELDAPPTGDGNNTGAFACRPTTGATSYSQHAYGLAIDVNPFQNPYIKGDLVLPELASSYLDRGRVRPGMIEPDGPVVRAFAAIGWTWGGDLAVAEGLPALLAERHLTLAAGSCAPGHGGVGWTHGGAKQRQGHQPSPRGVIARTRCATSCSSGRASPARPRSSRRCSSPPAPSTAAASVADHNTVCDFEEGERAHERSSSLAVAPVVHAGCKINLIDTPGYADFVGEVRAGLRAADCALFVVAANEPVDEGTRQLWRECAAVDMPRAVVVTKLDHARADFDGDPARRPGGVRRAGAAGRRTRRARRSPGCSAAPTTTHAARDADRGGDRGVRGRVADGPLPRRRAGRRGPPGQGPRDRRRRRAAAPGDRRVRHRRPRVHRAARPVRPRLPGPARAPRPGVLHAERRQGRLGRPATPTGRWSPRWCGRAATSTSAASASCGSSPGPWSPTRRCTSRATSRPSSPTDAGREDHDEDERIGALSHPFGQHQVHASRVVAGDIASIGRLSRAETGDTLSSPDQPRVLQAVDDADRAAARGDRGRRRAPTRTSSPPRWAGCGPRTPACASSRTPRPARWCSG